VSGSGGGERGGEGAREGEGEGGHEGEGGREREGEGGPVPLRLRGAIDAAVPVSREPRPLAGAIAIVAASERADADGMARMLGAAAREERKLEVATWRARARARASAEIREEGGATVIAASVDRIAAAIDDVVRARSAELVIAIGAPFVALYAPTLAILVTAGDAPLRWDPLVRSIRDRFALVIEEPRPRLARELVRRISITPRA
jgi:hypothetical protein